MIRAKKILDLDKKITDGTIVIASDIHIPFQDKAAVRAFLSYVKEKQPEVIVLNGDVLDMFMLSRFTKGEGRNPLEEIKMCQALLATLRSIKPFFNFILILQINNFINFIYFFYFLII